MGAFGADSYIESALFMFELRVGAFRGVELRMIVDAVRGRQ
jgi:hypothetical protein